MPGSILKGILYEEARGFITDTNSRSSINNGPFPNTALQYIERLLLIKRAKQEGYLPSTLGYR
jgi:hypothetical protein